MWFDMAGETTVDVTGSKTVQIHTTGNEKNRFTVILTCFADGSKMKPTVIFKGKQWSRIKDTPSPSSRIDIIFQDKRWMDKLIMLT